MKHWTYYRVKESINYRAVFSYRLWNVLVLRADKQK